MPYAVKRWMLLGGLALSVVSAGPASAQWFTYRPPVVLDELSPREMTGILLRSGFRQVSRPQVGDDYAVLTATDPQGRRVRITMDIFSGRILDAMPIAPPRRVARVPDEAAQPRGPAGPGPTVRPADPAPPPGARATPDRPTVIRREPMLPPQPGQSPAPQAAPAQPTTPEADPPRAAQGQPLGTRQQPRIVGPTPPVPAPPPPAQPRLPGEPAAPQPEVPVTPLL